MAFEKEPEEPLSPQELVEKTQDLMAQARSVLDDLKSLLGVEINGPAHR
jgi:hypothetical protein